MHYGQGNKLQDEVNPTGRDIAYFSKENFECLFWVISIIGFFSLFFAPENFIYFLIGSIIFFILSKLFR